MIGGTYFKSSITTNLEGLTPTSNYILYGTGSAWATTNSPSLAGLDLTGITDSTIPYMSASGLADSDWKITTPGFDATIFSSNTSNWKRLLLGNEDTQGALIVVGGGWGCFICYNKRYSIRRYVLLCCHPRRSECGVLDVSKR